MASTTLPIPRPALVLPTFSLLWREIIRFYRLRSRVVGVIASPLLFWLVIGSGFGASFRGAGGQSYLEFFYPGALVMVVLFTSIFAMMSVIEDRREGFLLSVMVAPISRFSIVLGKTLGGSVLAAMQGIIFLLLAPLVGATAGVLELLVALTAVALIAVSLTALGFVIAWRLDSTQAFHAIVNLFMMPLWMLSGALFPLNGAADWVRPIMLANPLTYGVDALRASLFPAAAAQNFPVALSMAVLAAFAGVMLLLAFVSISHRKRVA